MHLNLFCVPQLRSQMRIHAWPNGGCRWRRRGSLTTSLCGFEWVCVCVCVRQTWGGVKPESTISPSQVFHTRLPPHSALPAVCTLRAALLYDPDRWSGNLARSSCTTWNFKTLLECAFTRFFIKLWSTCLLKKKYLVLFAALPVLEWVFF